MKTYHEAPLSIFKDIQRVTDGDYALVHLFEENKEYFNTFKQAVADGREVILDNSLFELGESFDPREYVKWINKLNPTHYIIPDTLMSGEDTLKKLRTWMVWSKPNLKVNSKTIAVAQGKDYDDLVNCYRELDIHEHVDTIAFSFANNWFLDMYPNVRSKNHAFMNGRRKVLEDMYEDGIINTERDHHLLGCSLPQEFKKYREDKFHWIKSVDTSNPVTHGMKNILYSKDGLNHKISELMCEQINVEVPLAIQTKILYNIHMFKTFINKP